MTKRMKMIDFEWLDRLDTPVKSGSVTPEELALIREKIASDKKEVAARVRRRPNRAQAKAAE
jgi:hypothetical protein